jgi:hypothetical protein
MKAGFHLRFSELLLIDAVSLADSVCFSGHPPLIA